MKIKRDQPILTGLGKIATQAPRDTSKPPEEVTFKNLLQPRLFEGHRDTKTNAKYISLGMLMERREEIELSSEEVQMLLELIEEEVTLQNGEKVKAFTTGWVRLYLRYILDPLTIEKKERKELALIYDGGKEERSDSLIFDKWGTLRPSPSDTNPLALTAREKAEGIIRYGDKIPLSLLEEWFEDVRMREVNTPEWREEFGSIESLIADAKTD